MSQSKQQIVKYQQGKHSFKVVCYPGSVLKYREGKLDISHVYQKDTIFTNVARGFIASTNDLQSCFGPNLSNQEILTIIISQGEIEYSSSERKKFIDDKLNEIVYYINQNWINPKTKLPHPIDRIKQAILSSKKITIDIKQGTTKQANDIVKQLISQGTLLFAKAIIHTYKLTIKEKYNNKCSNLIYGIASSVKEDWNWNQNENGNECVIIYTIELTKGDRDNLIKALEKPTNDGNYGLIEQSMVSLSSSNNDLISTKDNKNGNGNSIGGRKGNKKYKGKQKKKQSGKHSQRGQDIAKAKQLERQQKQIGRYGNESKIDYDDDNKEQDDNNNNNYNQAKPGRKQKRKKDKNDSRGRIYNDDTSKQTVKK